MNEKTKEIRKRFKIDDVTGYPEEYRWRNLAKLGQSYKYEDPFIKFASRQPERDKAQHHFLGSLFALSPWMAKGLHCLLTRRHFLSRIYIPIIATPIMPAFYLYFHEKSVQRQAMKNGILIDYVRKHPERFGEIYRPKFREVLFEHNPRY